MSERMADSVSAESQICSMYCSRRRSSTSGVRASCARPTSAFSGVRISWLVLARNALLARLAASASSRARASACSTRRRSVTSSASQMVPLAGCVGSSALASRRPVKVLPSRRIIGTSMSTCSPRDSAGAICSLIASKAASEGQVARCCWFCSAPRGQPNISSKRALVITMRRSRVNEMPTSAFSRIASRSRRACSLAVTSRALVIW